jgi:ribosome-associated heat shock protein Hsp15
VKKETVFINGEICKPSRSIKIGDEIGLRKLGVLNSYEVKAIPHSRVGAALVLDYLIDRTKAEELEKAELLQLMRKIQRQRGSGRPTKKERRDIDKMHGDQDA